VPYYEVISLTNIAERAKGFTAGQQDGVGAASNACWSPERATCGGVALVNLVDTRAEYGIQELGPASGKTLPSSVQIASVMNGLSIGTFANPPQDKTKVRAIVDIHKGTIVAVAPVFHLPNLKRAVESSPQPLKQPRPPAQPAGVAATGQTIQASASPDSSREIPYLRSVGSGASGIRSGFELRSDRQQPVR
jgi:hypothetical protein